MESQSNPDDLSINCTNTSSQHSKIATDVTFTNIDASSKSKNVLDTTQYKGTIPTTQQNLSIDVQPDKPFHKGFRQRLRFSPKRFIDKSANASSSPKHSNASSSNPPQPTSPDKSSKPKKQDNPAFPSSNSTTTSTNLDVSGEKQDITEDKMHLLEPTKKMGPSDIDKDSKRIITLFTSLPPLKDAHISIRAELFQKKLIACQTLVDFSPDGHNQRVIELKRQTLLEIIEYISTYRNAINGRVLQDVIDMVSANVFRTLPKVTQFQNFYYDSDDDDPILERAWPHLQIVYDAFLRVIVSNEISTKVAKNAIDKSFVLQLLEMFSSGDQRERDYLKTILHRIYGKIMSLRNFIRKAMGNIFANFTYETESHYGIAELLEILGSIINGFALPLKEEHKLYLEKTLTPLHKPKSLAAYHSALVHCMIQYIEKDRTLAPMILTSILDYWPRTNTCKELLFLNELEEVLCLTEISELKTVITPLSKRIALCISSQHFQVSERILYVWNNERVARLLTSYKEIIYPNILPALYANSTLHWNVAVRELASNVSKILSDHDPALFMQYRDCNASSKSDFSASDWDFFEKSYLQR